MRALRRWSAALSARIHAMISELENHEALAEGAIRHAQALAARAEVRLQRVRRDGDELRERRERLASEAERWSQRATALVKSDELGALECLRQRRGALAQRSALETRLREHEQVEAQLTRTVQAMRERLSHLRHQRNQLRTRASSAEALRAGCARSDPLGVSLDDVFERWDARICEAELAHPLERSDAFAAELERVEELTSLRAELAALLDERPALGAGAPTTHPEGDSR